jgi:hypothetical protein
MEDLEDLQKTASDAINRARARPCLWRALPAVTAFAALLAVPTPGADGAFPGDRARRARS